jgi:putative nucleotidyltransferase with HDIG domain
VGDEGNGLNVDELVLPISDLLSLPDVCLRVQNLLAEPNVSAAQIGAVINYDPGLTARLLKIVNSAYYGMQSRIETVERAITVIGMKDLQALVLATSAVDTFNRISTDLVDMEAFWHHSVFTGLAARNLAREIRMKRPESIFVAALLHDVGKLILYQELPEESQQVLDRCADDLTRQTEIEQELLGFDHGMVGAALLRAWSLPENLVTAVRHHHQPDAAESYRIETAIVHIANGIACTVEPGTKWKIDEKAALDDIAAVAWEQTGLTPEVIAPTVTAVNMQSFELLEIITPGSLLIP